MAAFHEQAATAGSPDALRELAGWLRELRGREAEAEQTYRDAATARDPYALNPERNPDASIG